MVRHRMSQRVGAPNFKCAICTVPLQILVELAELQDAEVGDGTTSVVILAAELLKRANELVKNKIHPTSIISGYRLAMREVCGAGCRVDARAHDVPRSYRLLLCLQASWGCALPRTPLLLVVSFCR
jgi:hypothetical protein